MRLVIFVGGHEWDTMFLKSLGNTPLRHQYKVKVNNHILIKWIICVAFQFLIAKFLSISNFPSSSGLPHWLGLLWHSDQLLHCSLGCSNCCYHRLPYPLSEDERRADQGWEAAPDQEPLHSDWTHTRDRVPDLCVCRQQQPGESASDWHTGHQWVSTLVFLITSPFLLLETFHSWILIVNIICFHRCF